MAICCPTGASEMGGGRAPRFERGTYGVYVVWTGALVGCRGGGSMGPGLAGGVGGTTGLVGDVGNGRLVVDDDGVDALLEKGDGDSGTTSG
jgi:hypothetical protein